MQHHDAGGGLIGTLLFLLQLVFMIAAFILGIAFVLGLIGANPDGAFASWIYARANWLISPFEVLFPQVKPVRTTTIHLSFMFGIFAYVIIAALLEFVSRNLRRAPRG